jgi:hypothetical protein
MVTSGDKLFKFGAFLVLGLAVFTAVLINAKREIKVEKEAASYEDVAEELAKLHKRASNGSLPLLGTDTLEMSFIQAGFPPKRPMPSLVPRAELRGGTTTGLGKQTISVAHYVSDEARLTIFLLPNTPEAVPASAATVMRMGSPLRMARRGDVTVVFWRYGHWVTAVATEANDATRDSLVDLAWMAEQR